MCLCSEWGLSALSLHHLVGSNCRSEGEGTRKYTDRVELAEFESRKRREGLSSFASFQEDEQFILCV